MKKSILAIIAACTLFTSCDMNLTNPGVEDDETAVKGAKEILAFRNGLYGSLRSLMSGSYVTSVELQMDQFNGVNGNGTRGAQIANGSLNTSLSIAESAYGGCYGLIANINFMLEKAEGFLADGTLTADETKDVERYVGEAKVIRAYAYFYLLDHFCQNPATTNRTQEGLGMPIVLDYHPSGDTGSYPGRSSIQALIDIINTDLTEGYAALSKYEQDNSIVCAPNTCWLNTATITALQARMSLVLGDYPTALAKARQVIENTKYQLAEGQDYLDMWTKDESSELIFVPFVNVAEYGMVGSFNDAWNHYQYMPTFSDYLPSFRTLAQYDTSTDIRFRAFFKAAALSIEGSTLNAFQFMKFPGNAEIQGTAANRYRNKPKPFRLSEQYLIVAEAAAMTGDEATANSALEAIRSHRIENYSHTALGGDDLKKAIRMERTKELIGEGFRMSDLRRWEEGFERYAAYPINPDLERHWVLAGLAVEYKPNDFRYVWPIPASEIDINPQIKNQQNPGYE